MSVYRTVSEVFGVKLWRDLEIWVMSHSRSLKMVPFESSATVSYSHSIVTMALSCLISEIKRDIGRKSRFLIGLPAAFDAPVRGFPSECCHNVWCGKTEMVWLPDGGKSLMICLAISTQYWHVTDRRTSCDSIHHGIHSIARYKRLHL